MACAQAKALQNRGHRVQLVALWKGRSAPPSHVDGVELNAATARAFIPRTGFLGLFSWSYPRVLWRVIGESDVVHIHTGRDLASLAAHAVAALRGAGWWSRRTAWSRSGPASPRGCSTCFSGHCCTSSFLR